MPPNLEVLKQAFRAKAYTLTIHASKRAVERDIDDFEIEEAVLEGLVIEDYPDEKYGPSCLVMGGYTASGRVLHLQVSYPPNVKVITAYEPSSDDWEADWKTRRT